MLLSRAFVALVTLASSTSVLGHTYKLQTSLKGQSLLNFFTFQTGKADNGGVAYYQSLASAKKSNLVSVNSHTGAVKLAVSTVEKTSQRGALRLFSKSTFSNGGLFIFDVQHMPTGCGSWGALWFTGSNWPNDGEIDVIEGVNHQAMNSMSSHTNAGCTQQSSGFTGNWMMTGKGKNNCDARATNSQGCGIRSKSATSFGAPFNSKSGGVYAMQWDSSGVKVFHWLRGSVPSDVKSGKPNPSSKWGQPENFVAATNCPPFKHFHDLMLVINTNLCGTWASGVWQQDMSYAGGHGSCAAKTGYSTCEAYVKANGSKMKEMYWLINSIKIYK